MLDRWRRRWLRLQEQPPRSIRDRAFAGLLQLGTWPYRGVMLARNLAVETREKSITSVSVPVVSIGNLSVGGTGKTPAVEWAANLFRNEDWLVVLLSRGYGSSGGPNDEALVLEENCPDVPHLQGADRVALAHTAIEELQAEILILDDGFQHRRLARDFDLVLIDATRPPTRDALLPRGSLREPWSALRRAHGVLLTRCDQAPAHELASLRQMLQRRFPGLPVVNSIHAVTGLQRIAEGTNNSHGESSLAPVEALRGRAVLLVSGIGHPEAFRQTALAHGADIRREIRLGDHHAYTRADLEAIAREAEAHLPADGWILTTQKDLVKWRISTLGDRAAVALRVQLEFPEGDQALRERLLVLPRPSRTAENDPAEAGGEADEPEVDHAGI